MVAAPHDPAQVSPLERALAALESALAVVFARPGQVQEACDAIAHESPAWDRPERAGDLQRLAALVRTRRGASVEPVVALLRDAALRATRPWPVLEALLSSHVEQTCAVGLDTARALAGSAMRSLDPSAAGALATLADAAHGPLSQPDAVAALADLIGRAIAPGPTGDEALRALYLHPGPAALRRLAARALDLSHSLPDAALVRRVLPPADADVLAPLLAYTRANHLDLAGLVTSPGAGAPIAEALRAVTPDCPPALLADIVGELGWSRANLGLHVRRCVGVAVDGSLPFLLPSAMAVVVERLPGARRVSDHVLVTAHGGTPDAQDAQDAPAGEGDAVARFRALNLAHAEVLGDILDIAPLDPARVHTILGKMDGIVAEYASLFAARSDECAILPGLYDSLKRRILAELEAFTPGQPLTMELTRLVQMFEDPPSMARVQTLHGLKRYLHQKGLALGFGLLEAGHGTNRTVDLALCAPDRVLATLRRLEYVNFDPTDASFAAGARGLSLPYPVAIVADALSRQLLAGATSVPRVRVFCYGNEVHYFVSFRNHPVFIRVDYSPPLGGGMIDLAYYGVSKFEIDSHPAIALEGIQAFFRRLDFFVEVDTTRIHARYDKERARDLADICEKAEELFRLVPYLMDVDWVIGSLDLPEEARRAVGTAWADLFARWGVLPTGRLLTADRLGILAGEEARPEGPRELRWAGDGAYRDTVSGRPRPGFPGEVHAALAERGIELPLVEREREVGQVSFERHLLGPLRAAVERGELIEGPDGPRLAPGEVFRRQHEADRFAEMLAGDAAVIARASHVARLATALERTLTFETTGSVNGFDVQRAALVLRGESGAIFALRDGAGIFRLAIYAHGGAIASRRAQPGEPWQDTASCDVGALAALLRRNNFLPSWIDASSDDLPEARHLQALFATPNRRARPGLPPGARVVSSLRASPGRATGIARLGIAGRRPEDLEGGVLFSATLRPEDQTYLHHAVAIVGTGGGILSHAGLMAVQCGRPAIIMPGTWREETGGRTSIVYRRLEFDERERTVAGFHVVERCGLREYEERLREGDLVVVDADEGVLEVLGQQPTALALHESLRALESSARGLAAAADPAEVLVQRGRGLRAMHHLERLVARLVDPVLVQHAVRALVEQAGGARERARLARLLLETPATGAVAAGCLRHAVLELEAGWEDARDRAMRLIPSARGPHEVLELRREAVRARAAIEPLQQLLPACGLPAPGDTGEHLDALDAEAVGRLRELHGALLQRVSDAGPDAVAAPPFRHVVELARDLAEVID
ncbi:MAG: PEP-utilizing enzyme, partial [Vicinamibacterales bacterium]|nr:PEP-utilizing enzyme [Vicinamibacterales bacterium]